MNESMSPTVEREQHKHEVLATAPMRYGGSMGIDREVLIYG